MTAGNTLRKNIESGNQDSYPPDRSQDNRHSSQKL